MIHTVFCPVLVNLTSLRAGVLYVGVDGGVSRVKTHQPIYGGMCQHEEHKSHL